MGRGRGRLEVRRIENVANRQVTFSKRRRGLAKKARELAVLCDADVALIVFSDKGRVFDYAANHSMNQILDRYERHLLSEAGDVTEEHPVLPGNVEYDHIKLRSRIEALRKSQRNLMGEQLDSLTLTEVQQLEQQIESALKNIRSRKDNIFLDSIGELQKKERLLMEQNCVMEKEKAEIDASRHKNSTTSSTEVASLPNLNISADYSDEPGPATESPRAASGSDLPWWMLRQSANG